MPSSAVFSYWRRDHRRSSASPVSSAVPPPAAKPPAVSNKNPPQLPAIPHTTALGAPYGPSATVADASSPQVPSDYPSDLDLDKSHIAISTTTLDAPSSSWTNPEVHPSTSSEKNTRPRSSLEEREQDSPLTSQSNSSQPCFTPADGDSSKPNSPFRLSFGKALLNSHAHTSDGHSKRSSTSAVTPSSHLRYKASPDHSPADKTTLPQKDYKYEGSHNRRQGDRDMSAEHAHHKSGKAMLHLLNPMSLLARRRSSQYASLRAEEMNIGARNLVPAIPDDYDPRIRGSIVHDFSAPRPRRNLSATPALLHEVSSQSNPQDQSQPGRGTSHASDTLLQPTEPRKRHNEYSPVFREHFEEDQKVLQVENKAYLQSSLLTDSTTNDSHSMPVFAQKLPSSVPKQDEEHRDQSSSSQVATQDPPAKHSPPSGPSEDADTIDIVPHHRTGLPRHLKSNASRFSFDMNGVESSTQEKLLEEKHKEKEAARRAKAQQDGSRFSDDDDDFDNEILDDMDDLEEKIPGVNVDADETDEFIDFSGPGHIWNTSWLASAPSGVDTSHDSESSYTDTTSDSPDTGDIAPNPEFKKEPSSENLNTMAPSLPESSNQADGERYTLPSADQDRHPIDTQHELGGHRPDLPQLLEDDDDLYFDDGEFGDLTADDDGEAFDESIFDDETSHLYERKPAAAPIGPVQSDSIENTSALNGVLQEDDELDFGRNGDLKHMPSMASEYRGKEAGSLPLPSENKSALPSAKSHGGVLSEQNLEAFHHALEHAANQATTEGRFGRNISVSDRSLGQESLVQTMEAHPGLISTDTHMIQPVDGGDFEEVFEDFSYDDNDAAFYDDPIIAAANAEALENDDEGFYGQEFGFYAYANGNNNSELTNGGYFGPRGVEGVTRSFSSRGKFREPSLTPITERSEWSTRNSVISLTAHGAAHSNPMSSPGLAQLVDLGNIEDEISLSALMRLRRGAWGGSNGSLRSSSGSPPPYPHTASNRGSFTGLSDVSPTVYTAPPDFLGGPSLSESPMKDSDKSGPSQTLAQQQADACG